MEILTQFFSRNQELKCLFNIECYSFTAKNEMVPCIQIREESNDTV